MNLRLHGILLALFVIASFNENNHNLYGCDQLAIDECERTLDWTTQIAIGDCVQASRYVEAILDDGKSGAKWLESGLVAIETRKHSVLINSFFDRVYLRNDINAKRLTLKNRLPETLESLREKEIQFARPGRTASEYRNRYSEIPRILEKLVVAWQFDRINQRDLSHKALNEFYDQVTKYNPAEESDAMKIAIGFQKEQKLPLNIYVRRLLGDYFIERVFRKWSDPNLSYSEVINSAKHVLSCTSDSLNPDYETLRKFTLDIEFQFDECKARSQGIQELNPLETDRSRMIHEIIAGISFLPENELSLNCDERGEIQLSVLNEIDSIGQSEREFLFNSKWISKTVALGRYRAQFHPKIITVGELAETLINRRKWSLANSEK